MATQQILDRLNQILNHQPVCVCTLAQTCEACNPYSHHYKVTRKIVQLISEIQNDLANQVHGSPPFGLPPGLVMKKKVDEFKKLNNIAAKAALDTVIGIDLGKGDDQTVTQKIDPCLPKTELEIPEYKSVFDYNAEVSPGVTLGQQIDKICIDAAFKKGYEKDRHQDAKALKNATQDQSGKSISFPDIPPATEKRLDQE